MSVGGIAVLIASHAMEPMRESDRPPFLSRFHTVRPTPRPSSTLSANHCLIAALKAFQRWFLTPSFADAARLASHCFGLAATSRISAAKAANALTTLCAHL